MAVQTGRYPHITRDDAVQGGVAVLRGTRLPVRAVAFYWRAGANDDQILRAFPQLSREILAEAVEYYKAHRAEIDAELEEEQRADAGA